MLPRKNKATHKLTLEAEGYQARDPAGTVDQQHEDSQTCSTTEDYGSPESRIPPRSAHWKGTMAGKGIFCFSFPGCPGREGAKALAESSASSQIYQISVVPCF